MELIGEALEIAGSGSVSGRTHTPPGSTSAQFLLRPTMFRLVPVVVRAVRRELRRDSPVFRHAVRLAAVATLGYLIAARLPLGHGYWAPITSVMVMRPDFHRTYARAVARLAGTLAGVALATGMVRALGRTPSVFGALAVVSAGLSYTLNRTGYAYSQCFTAAYVVFLLGMGGQAWEQTVPGSGGAHPAGRGLANALAYGGVPRTGDTPAAGPACGLARRPPAATRPRCSAATPNRPSITPTCAGHCWRAGGTCRLAGGIRPGKAGTGSPRGLTSREAQEAQEALEGFGRAAMLMESHVPRADSRFAPEAERFAEALGRRRHRAGGSRRARATGIGRPGRVEEALHAWEGAAAGDRSPVVRRGAELQKKPRRTSPRP